MEDAAEHHEDMPDGVAVRQFTPLEEQYPGRVAYPANDQESQAQAADVVHHFAEGQQRQPTHCHIKPDRGFYEPGGKTQLDD